jgi:hypothetical protein
MNMRLYLICSLSAMLLNHFGNRLLKCGKRLGTDFQSVASGGCMIKKLKLSMCAPLQLFGRFGNSEMNSVFKTQFGQVCTLKKHKNAPRLEDHKQAGGCSGAEIVGQRTGEENQTTTKFALA